MKYPKPLLAAVGVALVAVVGAVAWKQSLPKNPPAEKPINNATALKTPLAQPIHEETVAYYGETKGFYVRPDNKKAYPGVVMIHENKGINDGIRDMARQMAAEGYVVLAVDLYGRSVETQDEARALNANFDQTEATKNLRAAVSFLREKGATKIASLGWCFGGGQSMQLALSGERMDATVIYYGRLVTEPSQLSVIKWPVLGIFGDKDQAISVESVNQFDAALDGLGTPNEIHMYPGVGHAFANPSGANYAPAETKDAWTKTVDFLDRNLQ